MSSSIVFLTFEIQSLQGPGAHHFSKASQPASQPVESLPFHLCSAGLQVHATKLCFCYMGASEGLHLTEPYPKPNTHLLTLYLLLFQLPNPVQHQQESSTSFSRRGGNLGVLWEKRRKQRHSFHGAKKPRAWGCELQGRELCKNPKQQDQTKLRTQQNCPAEHGTRIAEWVEPAEHRGAGQGLCRVR